MQLTLNLPKQAQHNYDFGVRSSGETHGVVLTKPHIVELILDLAGYTTDKNLGAMALLEPSCGHGAFLVPAVERLIEAARREGLAPSSLQNAIRAFDIDPEHVAKTKTSLFDLLIKQQVRKSTAEKLVNSWVQEDDFLLAPLNNTFDVVVGNPPYIRIEQLPTSLHEAYRKKYRSLFDRADLYVAFIERGLSLLNHNGFLSFICADRWTMNKYGAPLRSIVNQSHQVKCYIDLHTASPFESDVIAYPSIFVLGRGKSEKVPVVTLKTGSEAECHAALHAINTGRVETSSEVKMALYPTWFEGEEPWTLSSPEHLETLRYLENKFQEIEATAKVGIGVATGADSVFIVRDSVNIESDRLVPLVMREDIHKGTIKNATRFVINPFDTNGKVVDLSKFPLLEKYLTKHEKAIRQRHVAKVNPKAWFRTIDRVYPELVTKPKLLIPDIAGSNEVVFDDGQYHPHHNLYFVTSEKWDLEVLGGLLSSKVALFFVWSYAVKMRGGYLRFQAQYLRRIRLPDPKSLPTKLTRQIRQAFRLREFAKLDQLALVAYGMKELPVFDFVDTRN